MKINEINQPTQIDEGIGSALIGDRAAAAVRGFFSGKGTKHTMYQQAFLKDFYQDAITSLDNGIRGGFVDMSLSSAADGTETDSSTTPLSPPRPSSAAVPTTSPTQVPPAQQTGQTMSPQQTATAKMQTRAGIQPTGQKMTAAQRTQAQLQARKMKAAQKPVPVKESAYDKMNRIFESIMEAEGNQGISIGKFMTDWFAAYMAGTKWESYKAQVEPMIQAIEDTYASDKGKKAIKQLANTAFSISKLSPTKPKGAPEPTGDQKADEKQPNNNVIDTIRNAAAGDDVSKQIDVLAQNPKAAEAMKAWAARN
jgi:hypothetical protein